MNRARSGRLNAGPLRGGFLAGLAAAPACRSSAHAADAGELSTVDLYLDAFAELDRHEFAALGLTLGVLCLRW